MRDDMTDVPLAQSSPSARVPGQALGWLRRLMPAALAVTIVGCSLLTIKSPEKPLSPRDLNSRILAHAFSARFDLAIEQTADEIADKDKDPTVGLNALRWKIGATGASQRAASQVLPMVGLLDLWALSAQMQAYLTEGNGSSLFRRQQTRAVTLAADLEREARALVQEVTEPQEFDEDRRFVEQYVRTYPIEGLDFSRASLVDLWVREKGSKTGLTASLGTVPEAVSDAVDVMRMYGDSAPSQALWRAELAVQESGVAGKDKDIEAAFRRLDARFSRLSALADSTPGLVDNAVRDAGKRFDASWTEMMNTVRTERVALSATVSSERQAAVEALDTERAAVDADAARVASQVISDAGKQARLLVREALLLAMGLALVVLGLPFAAGYLLGRSRRTA
jgi:hypothetical protein